MIYSIVLCKAVLGYAQPDHCQLEQHVIRDDLSYIPLFCIKAYAWRDLHVKEKVPASQRIYRDQSARARATTPTSLPRHSALRGF